MEQKRAPSTVPGSPQRMWAHERGWVPSAQALLTPWPSASGRIDTLNSDGYTPRPGEPAEVRVCGGSCQAEIGILARPWVCKGRGA